MSGVSNMYANYNHDNMHASKVSRKTAVMYWDLRCVLCVCLTVSIMVFIVASTGLGLAVAQLRDLEGLKLELEIRRVNSTVVSPRVCLPCPTAEFGRAFGSRSEEGGHLRCCAENSNQLRQLFDAFTDELVKGKKANATVSSRVDHPVCVEGETLLTANNTSCVLENKDTLVAVHAAIHKDQSNGNLVASCPDGIPLFRRGVNCSAEGRLVVLEAGLYHVYSQVMMQWKTKSNHNVQPKTNSAALNHFVNRYNEDYPSGGVKLMFQSTESNVTSSLDGDDNTHTSYVAGLIHLEVGDQVYVEVSNHRAVVLRTSSTSYLGFFKI